MFSESMSAHLHELLGSMNLSYQYYAKEKGLYSIQIEYMIQKLFELLNSKHFPLQDFIEKIEEMNKNIEITKETITIDNKKEEDLFGTHYMYMRSMTFAQLQMTVSIAERILNQRYFIQFYQVDDEEAGLIKNFLKTTIAFLSKFSKTTI
jgi:hypothetical protein